MTSAAPVSGGAEYYGYAPDNKRIYRLTAAGTEEWTLFGAYGEKLSVFHGGAAGLTPVRSNVQFAGRTILDNNFPVFQDRVGTDRASGARFMPYGDEITSTTNDRQKFATYTRDSYTGLDYADQRMYASTYGRFLTADPWAAGGARKGSVSNPADPGSWNRYAYVEGDPINYLDPRGEWQCSPSLCGTQSGLGSGLNFGPPQPLLGNDLGGAGIQHATVNAQGGGASTAGESSGIVTIANWTNQGKQAQIVQNDLSWIGAQISQFPTCDSWLSANSPLGGISGAILTMLGQNPSSGITQDMVGVGNISSPSSNNVINAVAGTDGTSLSSTALVAITVNSGGAFFNSSAPTGVTGITGGTQQAQLLILLHELAHLTNAAGFIAGDSSASAQGANNMLLMQNCATFINSVPNTAP